MATTNWLVTIRTAPTTWVEIPREHMTHDEAIRTALALIPGHFVSIR